MHLGYDTKVSQVETENKLLNTSHESTLSYKSDFVGINLEA